MAGPWEKYQEAKHPSLKYRADLRDPRALDYERLKYSPTVGMSKPERLTAGFQRPYYATARTLGNLAGGISDEEYAEARRLDEPLRATTEGQIGEFVGNTAMYMPLSALPGAGTIRGGIGYGALAGLTQEAGSLKERISNILFSGLGGGAVAGVAKSAVPLRNLKPGLPPRDPLLDEMTSAGFRVTPVEAKAGMPLTGAQGLAGSAKLEKLNAVHNQVNANKLVKQEFGLPADDRLTAEQLEQLRRQAGTAYEKVKSSLKIIKADRDPQFLSDIAALRGDLTQAAREYPEQISNDAVETLISSLNRPASPRAMVELTRHLRRQAAANIKAYDDASKQELGFAQRKAATALENLIDRSLTSVGKSGLVNEWRQARQLIAKTYDVETALNKSTGDVSIATLARLYAKGEPFTGNLEKVARFGAAYKKSAQDVVGMSDAPQFSGGDIGMGALGGFATGEPTGMAAMGVRPGMRFLMSSPLTQRFFARPREMPLSDLRNIDTVTRAALPITLGGLAVRKKEDQE